MEGDIDPIIHSQEKQRLLGLYFLNCQYENFLLYPIIIGKAWQKVYLGSFPSDPVVKNLPCNAGETTLILVWEDPCRATKPMCHNY